ncbi:MAG: hypothetical protein ACLRX3_12745 [Subdoligranulum sp.]
MLELNTSDKTSSSATAAQNTRSPLACAAGLTGRKSRSGGCVVIKPASFPHWFGLNFVYRQYRIILSADTASEVRQMLSQKRR